MHPHTLLTTSMYEAPYHLDQNLFNIRLLSSSSAHQAHIYSHYNNIIFYFWNSKHSYFPLDKYFCSKAPAAALCAAELCSWFTAVTSQCQHQTLASDWLVPGHWLLIGYGQWWIENYIRPLENCSLYSIVWNQAMKEIFQEMRGYHISWPIDIW